MRNRAFCASFQNYCQSEVTENQCERQVNKPL